jgi:2-polyprenyl-6-hydroxyphenyl methylase/3-demethylubiquinone-9 3-methyltransferase
MTEPKKALFDFYQQVGERYDEEENVYQTLRGILRKRFIMDILADWQGSLLDIGCNKGMYLHAYQGGERFGVDLSLPVLQKIRDPQHTLHLAVADAENLGCLAADAFDHVLCSEVLEHCLHPEKVFQGIAHILKLGGTALITTPNYRGQKPQWISLGPLHEVGVECDCDEGYFHTAYRPKELQELSEQAGLQVVKAGTLEKQIKYAAKIPAAFLLAGRALNRIFRSKRFGLWNENFVHLHTLYCYTLCQKMGLEKWLTAKIKEGVRSYILVKKTES